MVRYASDGTPQWRVDLARTRPYVARLLVDTGGDAYLAFSSLGDGQDINVHKYDPSGVLLWSQVVSTGSFANDMATSLALSPDGTDLVVTGDIAGGANWITAAYNAATGARKWLVSAAEGIAARDVVVDAARVYVTGAGNVGITGFLTVVAYDRATGQRLWRTDKKPADGSSAAGLRMDLEPDGSLVVAGQASRGFLDWYTVAFETGGAVRWETVRDGGLNTDEIPAGVLAMADGTTVVTGRGGPNLPGGYIQGVTAGYDQSGTLLWEAFSGMETIWTTALPNGDLCASGGYDALITCWHISDGAARPAGCRPHDSHGLACRAKSVLRTNDGQLHDSHRAIRSARHLRCFRAACEDTRAGSERRRELHREMGCPERGRAASLSGLVLRAATGRDVRHEPTSSFWFGDTERRRG